MAMTRAPTISAFCGSVIRPVIEAFVDCERATPAKERKSTTTAMDATRRIWGTSSSFPNCGFIHMYEVEERPVPFKKCVSPIEASDGLDGLRSASGKTRGSEAPSARDGSPLFEALRRGRACPSVSRFHREARLSRIRHRFARVLERRRSGAPSDGLFRCPCRESPDSRVARFLLAACLSDPRLERRSHS